MAMYYNVVGIKPEGSEPAKSSLINRNIVVNGHRTSVRLEAEMWSDLQAICRRENKSLHEMCSLISANKKGRRSLTSAIRVFLLGYYRAAATEEGHSRAGHGGGYQIGHKIEMPPREAGAKL
jgi:predicted DNA-binding ribbon-helix-helix protein